MGRLVKVAMSMSAAAGMRSIGKHDFDCKGAFTGLPPHRGEGMRTHKKRALMVAVAVVVLLAAGGALSTLDDDVSAADVTVSNFIDLGNEIASAPSAVSYTIAVDTSFEITSKVSIPADRSITITSLASGSPVTLKRNGGYASDYLFEVASDSVLNFEDIVIDGNGSVLSSAGIVHVAGGVLNLEAGAVLQNNICTSVQGGAVYADAGSKVNIHSGAVRDNAAKDGGGVYLVGIGSMDIRDATITGNSAAQPAGNGGGIFLQGGGGADSNLKLYGDTVISDNTAGNGGGIYAGTRVNILLLEAVEVADNVAQTSGGGIFAETSCVLTMTGSSSISGNYAAQSADGSGGGAFIGDGTISARSALALHESSKINDNRVGYDSADVATNNGDGGGVHVGNYADVTMSSNATVSNNKANGNGGGIHANEGATSIAVTLSNNAGVGGNAASSSGGGIYGTRMALQMSGQSSVSGNIAAQSADGNGGGVCIGDGASNLRSAVELRDTAKIDDNKVGYKADGTTVTGYSGSGGGIYAGNYADVALSVSAEVNGNKARTSGGGIYVRDHAAVATSGDATVEGNYAGTSGGGIYAGEFCVLDMAGQSSISSNLAAQAALGYGGGVFINSGTGGQRSEARLRDSAKINDNRAGYSSSGVETGFSGSGGGLYVVNYVDVTLSVSAQISYNVASNSGGGIFAAQHARVALSGDATVEGNSARTYGGGVFTQRDGTLDMAGRSSVSYNLAAQGDYGYGGGVYMGGGTSDTSRSFVSLSGSAKISNNLVGYKADGVTSTGFSGYGGGIYAEDYVDVTISGSSEVSSNSDNRDGGGMYVGRYANITMSDNAKIANNSAAAYGGGIYALDSGALTMVGQAAVSNNLAAQSADGDGGGVYMSSGSSGLHSYVSLSGSAKISNNLVGYKADGVTSTGFSGDGGGIYAKDYVDVTMSGTAQVSGNKAKGDGGGIYVPYSRLSLVGVAAGVVFSDNVASRSVSSMHPVDQATYAAKVLSPSTAWTSSFTVGYNNYDISYYFSYIVAYDANGGSGSVPVDIGTYTVNNNVTVLGAPLPSPAGSGTFRGWSLFPNLGHAYIAGEVVNINPAAAGMSGVFGFGDPYTITLYASWGASTYTISAYSDEGSEIVPEGSTSVNFGDSLTYTFKALPGHSIARLLVDGAEVDFSSGSYTFSNVRSNHTIFVVSEGSDVLTLVVEVTGGEGYPEYRVGSAPYSRFARSAALAPGSDLRVSVEVAEGYRLVGWSGDVTQSDEEVHISDVRSDVYLLAILEPVGAGDGGGDTFAVLNLICAALAVLTGIAILVMGRGRRDKDDADRRSKTAILARVASLIVGIASAIAFLVTEDTSLRAVATDEWSPLMAVLLIVAIVLALASLRFDKGVDAEATEE